MNYCFFLTENKFERISVGSDNENYSKKDQFLCLRTCSEQSYCVYVQFKNDECFMFGSVNSWMNDTNVWKKIASYCTGNSNQIIKIFYPLNFNKRRANRFKQSITFIVISRFCDEFKFKIYLSR